jgi:hypothetical protein
MKKILLILLVAMMAVAGTVTNPTPVKVAVQYPVGSDASKNYFILQVNNDGNVLFFANTSSRSIVNLYDINFNIVNFTYAGQDGKSLLLSKGKYIAHVILPSDITSSNFYVVSSVMSGAPDYSGNCAAPDKVNKTDISSLSPGWHLIGTTQKITDLSIFDSAKSVWSWENGWSSYSPIAGINDTIKSSPNIDVIKQINSKRGFWVFK